MSAPAAAPCDFLPWDTDFFQVRIGRVRGETLTPELAAQVEAWSREQRIRGLYFLARADDPPSQRTAEAHDFAFVDIRLTLDLKLPARAEAGTAVSGTPAGAASLRPAREEDLPALQSIARSAHRDTRFFSDTHFAPARAEDFYSTWIALECRGRAQQVLVAGDAGDKAVGYISCHLDVPAAKGQIGLVGVAAEARGAGLGKGLVLAAVNWLAGQGAREVAVVTQGRNIPAQRLYQRCGFLTQTLQLWYHKWYG